MCVRSKAFDAANENCRIIISSFINSLRIRFCFSTFFFLLSSLSNEILKLCGTTGNEGRNSRILLSFVPFRFEWDWLENIVKSIVCWRNPSQNLWNFLFSLFFPSHFCVHLIVKQETIVFEYSRALNYMILIRTSKQISGAKKTSKITNHL